MKKIALSLIAVIILVGFIACTQIPDPLPESSTTEVSSTDTSVEVSSVEELEFNSREEMVEHFLGLWREQYRTRNGYEPTESLELLETPVSGMFRTSDGKVVSRGALPYETMKVLKKYGDGTFEGEDVERVYQIVGTSSGTIYDAMTSNFKYFYSGNRLDTLLEDLNDLYSKEERSILSTTDLKYLLPVIGQPVEYAKRAANW